MILIDTNFLIFVLDPGSTQQGDAKAAKVRHLLDTLSRSRTEVMVAAPSVAELVAGRSDRIDEIVQALKGIRALTIQPFDEVIAIETGDRIAQAVALASEKPAGWKVAMKYDAMIAATAVVRGASHLYTDDPGLRKYLAGSSVEVVLIDDLPDPPANPQQSFNLET